MKFVKRMLVIMFVAIGVSCLQEARCGDVLLKPEVTIVGQRLIIKAPSAKVQRISIGHDMSWPDIELENLTFGNYAAIKVLDEVGATQKFYRVFLYDETKGIYVYNKSLSGVPCLEADQEKKELVGACFHDSSCSNWIERYKVDRAGRLSLVERSGMYCDAAGQTYSYTENYRTKHKSPTNVKNIR
ncbi:XAC2610-related protein [Paraburkholderia phenoliruptrix]|uniref:XAC2610-related protein n=1 Tax=Paraburkholderia phenoliruptrix TaxID=252970 RepID=UPI0001C02A5A|nr:hypothetical protein [Paraburkholderia phenoliruptrix]MDR6390869.1 hypothetical protein [Paraburkholderia phenoliruptrix]WMY11902.1 hypothetical protein P3F88_21105 [Paraburkholderia phenoliruptrix]